MNDLELAPQYAKRVALMFGVIDPLTGAIQYAHTHKPDVAFAVSITLGSRRRKPKVMVHAPDWLPGAPRSVVALLATELRAAADAMEAKWGTP